MLIFFERNNFKWEIPSGLQSLTFTKTQADHSTVSGVLPLPVLVQFEDVQEDLAGQAAITAAPIRGEKRWRGLQWGQAAAGGSHWVQRRPRVPATRGLAAALHRQVTAAVTEQKHKCETEAFLVQTNITDTRSDDGWSTDCHGYLSFLRSR